MSEGYTFDPADERHGTRYAYVVLRCRCPSCRGANAVYIEEYRRRERS